MKPSRFLGKLRPQVASVDAVFSISTKAKVAIDTIGKDHVINATLGALYDDLQQLVTFPSVYQTFKQLHDAVEMKTIPVVEVHFSNIKKREPWRAQSVISPVVDARFFGEGMMSYEKAFQWLMNLST